MRHMVVEDERDATKNSDADGRRCHILRELKEESGVSKRSRRGGRGGRRRKFGKRGKTGGEGGRGVERRGGRGKKEIKNWVGGRAAGQDLLDEDLDQGGGDVDGEEIEVEADDPANTLDTNLLLGCQRRKKGRGGGKGRREENNEGGEEKRWEMEEWREEEKRRGEERNLADLGDLISDQVVEEVDLLVERQLELRVGSVRVLDGEDFSKELRRLLADEGVGDPRRRNSDGVNGWG
eukprot:757818-Hanusia_phi.AAC.1